MRSAKLILVLFLLGGVFSAPARAAQRSAPVQVAQVRREPEDPLRQLEDARQSQAKRANQDRQKALQRDTDRLMQLATELKQYVDKSNENMLSIDVIRKAEQIEKLAKNVKDKMKADAYMPSIAK